MINDIHIHLGKSECINREFTVEQLIKMRYPYSIDNVVVMGSDSDYREVNDILPKLCNENEWMYGLCWATNIHDTQIPIEGKIVGLKFHGVYLNMPVTSLSYKILEKLKNKILLVHCGRYLEGDVRSNTSYLHALELARHYPDIKVVLAHMGGTDTTVCKKAIHHARGLHNVYFDTSGITTPYIIEYACNHLPSTRIIFGSDLPWCSFNAMIWNIEDANISNESKQKIRYDNLETLLK